MPSRAPYGAVGESHPGVNDLSRDIGDVLSIGKLAGGPDAGRYYEEAVAQGREDYYAGEGERPGTWCGGAAATLGLAGTVDDGQVGRLLAGEDPSTGQLLGRKVTEGGVAGFDLTFKAPKSVSVLFGIADPDIAGALHGCHDAAVADAVAYLERHACQARRAHWKRKSEF